MFVTVSHFHPSQLCVVKARAYPIGPPYLSFPANIRLELQRLTMTNLLGYSIAVLIKTVKSFIVQTSVRAIFFEVSVHSKYECLWFTYFIFLHLMGYHS